MAFLNATNPQTIKLARTAMMGVGFKAQRLANDMLKKVATKQTQHPPATVGRPIKEQVIHFINKKMPGGLPKKTARALLDIEDNKIVPIIRNPKSTTAETEAVFYFPGCGSERLFSRSAWPRRPCCGAGVQTVLPPGYLCCGYPQRGSGQYDKAEKIITDNRVLFHRVANTLNYLDIKTVVCRAAPATTSCRATSSTRSSRLPHHRHPRVPAREGHQARRRDGHALHVPRPCHTPMKTRTRSSRQRADGRGEDG
jgi:Fe-S oxidoreductase